MKLEKSKYQGIYLLQKNKRKLLLTKNLTPEITFFNENTIEEYRVFDPFRSKLAAALIKKISLIPIKKDSKILYLGAAHGYTSSYISDIVGKQGILFCLDFAARVVRDLLFVCEKRENMIPILASANKPETYKDRITKVDLIYQDIAQKNQVDILLKNLQFLKPKGYVLLAIKARSIDVTKLPKKIYKIVEEQLKPKLKIIDKKELDPFEKDHCFFVCQKKN